MVTAFHDEDKLREVGVWEWLLRKTEAAPMFAPALFGEVVALVHEFDA